jgi:hypothetical protein
VAKKSDQGANSMASNVVLVGVYTFLDDAIKSIKKVQEEGLSLRVYSPVPHHELEELTKPEQSPVRWFTLTGAITGITSGFALAIWTSLDYPLRVSAKTIASVPGFVVIGYECTILFGGLATLLALLIFCRIPDVMRKIGFDKRFTQDKFGVVVGCPADRLVEIKAALEAAGADEVQVREGL